MNDMTMGRNGEWTRRRCLGFLAAGAASTWLPARAGGHEHHGVAPDLRRSLAEYTLPDAPLVRDDGQRVSLARELNDGRLVMLNFVFTTCTAICPVTSQIFSETQSRLRGELDRVHMMSISIDPENDTPARLREYARRFGAGPQWQHYTASNAASIAVQKAFATYRGDKMNHQPVTLLRRSAGQPWVRLEGFVSPSELAGEVKTLLGGA